MGRGTMRVAIYARVSTADQNSELQLRELPDGERLFGPEWASDPPGVVVTDLDLGAARAATGWRWLGRPVAAGPMWVSCSSRGSRRG